MDIMTDWYITENQPFSKVSVNILSVEPIEEVDFAVLQALCRLFNEKKSPSVPFLGKIYTLGEPLIGKFFGKYEVSIEDSETLSSSKDLQILNKFGPLISHYLGKTNGFNKKESNKIFGGKATIISTLQIYNGIISQSRILPSGDVITSIDSTKRWIQTLDQYIASLMTKGYSEKQILTILKDSIVSCPSYLKRRWFDAKLKRFTDMTAKDKIPGKNKTFIEFWNQWAQRHFIAKYDLTISQDTPIVEVCLQNGGLLHYPISIIRTKIDVSTVSVSNKKIDRLSKRLKLSVKIAKKIFTAPLAFGKLKLQYNIAPLTGVDLTSLGFSYGVFSAPELLLGDDTKVSISRSKDIDDLLRKHGPWSGPKVLTLHYLTPPLDAFVKSLELDKDELIRRLHKDLQSGADTYHLGTFQRGNHRELNSGTPAEFSSNARELGEQNRGSTTDIIVPIFPEIDNARCYALTKRALGDTRTNSKGIHWDRFKIIAQQESSRVRHSTRNLMALGIYSRALEAGEAGILLANPARGLPNEVSPLILAVDISRDLKKKQEATADIITMNGRGLLLSSPTTYNFDEGLIQSELILEWLVDRTTFAVNKVTELSLSTPNTLIFGYDGRLRRKQVEEFEKGVSLAMEELIAEDILPQDAASVILEITKRVPDRIYREDGTLPPEGTYLTDPLNTGYLIGSYPRRGTSQLLRVRIASQTKEVFTAKSALQFIHDMRYLDIASPYVQPREAIFMHVVDKKAKLSRHGAVPYIPF
ncbi:MAG: hypothetical protein ACFFCD_01910 [Promethearchaeota archaeon]